MSGATLPRNLLSTIRGSAPARRAGPIAWMGHVLRAVQSRRLLRDMDDRMLSDIGIGRAEAQAEADRAPWDLAQHRRAR